MKHTWKTLLALSLLVNLIILGIIIKKYSQRDTNISSSSAITEARTKLISSLESDRSSVVFIGDSQTEGFPLQEMFMDLNFKNRGVSGNTNTDILNRTVSAVRSQPAKVFIMSGINDLAREKAEVKETFDVFRQIIKTIRKSSPGSKIYIQSLLPIRGDVDVNLKVREYNHLLKTLSDGKSVFYLDLYYSFAQDGEIKDELTTDGLHLSELGYLLWKEQITELLK